MGAIQKCTFELNLSYCVKSCGHFCEILAFFYDARSQNMVMLRDSRSKFSKKLYVFLILQLILGIVTKFVVEKPFTSEVISQKPHVGGWKTPPSAFRVNPILLGSQLALFC